MWWLLAAMASTQTLGDPTFRAPDGIARAVVTESGAVWVLSPRGEVAGFDPKGRLLTTFQACTDRGAHLDLEVDPRGSRAGVDCDNSYRVFALPAGELLFEEAVFAADSAFSPDGRKLAVLGERILDGVSENASFLLQFDATTGEALEPVPSDWEAIWGVKGGWIGATTRERPSGPLHVGGHIDAGPAVLNWHWVAPEKLRTTADWGAREAVAVMDGGAQVCVQYDFGGACLDGRTGGARNFWSVPKSEHSAATRATPHPDGLAIGSEIWFEREAGVYRWKLDGQPERLFHAESIPVANPSGDARFQVGQAHLVPVDETGRPDTEAGWDLPKAVSRSADGRVLALVDNRGRVFFHDAKGTRDTGWLASDVRVEPDGSEVWLFDDDGPTRVVPVTGHPKVRELESPAVAFEGDRAVGVQSVDGGQQLVDLRTGETICPISDVFEVTGLQVVGNKVLVEFDQDDAWQLYRDGVAEPVVTQSFMAQTDVRLTPAGVFGVEESDKGWKVGRHVVPWSSTVRFLPDGSGFIVLAEDAKNMEIREFPSGALRSTRELPGRWSSVWVDRGQVIIALRDGRLVVSDL